MNHRSHDFSQPPIWSRFRLLNWRSWPVDPVLLTLLALLAGVGFFVLYSASNESFSTVERQALHLFAGFVILLIFAQIPPIRYFQWAPYLFGLGLFLLLLVPFIGEVSQGARRWLNFGFFHLQPSEIMKLAVPMMLARYLSQQTIPLKLSRLFIAIMLLMPPVLLTAKQPDLGTAILIAVSGAFVLFLAGLHWRILIGGIIAIAASTPILWHFMHGYQKDRILSLINPERDPLGKGYHIIQSKIAIGSGGFWGKGWLQGTQSHLKFLPAHTTDFIFAVVAEEFGFIGCLTLIFLFIAILARCLYISLKTQDGFTRLLAGSFSFTFITCAFINIGMVIGLLPVVGVPLPFISYGGSSLLTMMAAFGILMSIYSHRKLWIS